VEPQADRASAEPRARYRRGLVFSSVYPYRSDRRCRCGCGEVVPKRRRFWASTECSTRAVRRFRILKGDSRAIRDALYERDQGVCAGCRKQRRRAWEADHIVPVAHGGAGCDLTNFQTLCRKCHRAKTAEQGRARRRRSEGGPVHASASSPLG
jgi:5-methylcytosine-specific restriction endonuclease McrA